MISCVLLWAARTQKTHLKKIQTWNSHLSDTDRCDIKSGFSKVLLCDPLAESFPKDNINQSMTLSLVCFSGPPARKRFLRAVTRQFQKYFASTKLFQTILLLRHGGFTKDPCTCDRQHDLPTLHLSTHSGGHAKLAKYN